MKAGWGSIHYRANFLQDGPSPELPQGGHGLMAAGRGRRRQGAPATSRSLHRHGPLAQWKHRYVNA